MLQNICYLIIDDPADRDLLNTAIRESELNYERIADKSLERAKERFSRDPDFHPSYIFIDWNLELLDYIKAIPHLAGVPVIIYTGAVTAADIIAAKRAGAAHCLLKTTHETALTHTLLPLFNNKDVPFVMVYHPEEESKGFLR